MEEGAAGLTWVVGDIHGCADALARLLDALSLRPQDRLVSAGDLFHRGPEPYAVLTQLKSLGNQFAMVMGNHEWALMQRIQQQNGSLKDLQGDNGAELAPLRKAEAKELIAFIKDRPCFLEGQRPDGQPWYLVHASVLPGKHPSKMTPLELVRLSRCRELSGKPTWHQQWQGPELVVFGHAQSLAGPKRNAKGTYVAWGLDTGCVYGKELTALCVEELRTVSVPYQA